MKLLNILSLLGICFAAPALSHGGTPSAVQSLTARINIPPSAANIVPTPAAPFTAEDKARSETPDRATPDNLYRITISFSEYCENGALKARGWLGNGQVSFELYLNAKQVTKLNLHSGYDQILGPYNFEAHAFAIEYDGCKWTSEGGYPCGWCEAQPWTLGPLNCQTEQPGNQRLTYRTCYFIDKRMTQHLSARELHPYSPSLAPPTLQNITLEFASPTTLPPPAFPAPPPPATDPITAQASTILLQPAIQQTTTPDQKISTILPFRIRIFETCNPSAPRTASAIYTNGNMAQTLSLAPGLITSIQHRVPGYANLEVGPFDYAASRLRFRHVSSEGECVWTDEMTWLSCGECRAGQWSGPVLDCGSAGGRWRWKELDCSVLLGSE